MSRGGANREAGLDVDGGEGAPRGWWENGWAVALVLLLMALPLAWPAVPPLTDLPGHMGRYKIAADLASSPSLQSWFSFHWALIPNLGVDLIVVPLARVAGIEAATKAVALLIPPLTVAGFLWTAREAHGRLSPTYLFAAPLAFGFPFLYGFLNFTLAAALAFLAAGLWARLGRTGRVGVRAALFVPIAFLLWIAHAFGWGMLGLLAFAFEWDRQQRLRPDVLRSAMRAALHCLPLAAPLVLMLAWRSSVDAPPGDWFNVPWKLGALMGIFRDRWLVVDLACTIVALMLLFLGARSPRLGYARPLALAAILFALVFVLIPGRLMGGAHTDDRLAPYMIAVGLLALAPAADAPPRFVRTLAFAGLAFLVLRMGAATASAALYARTYERELQALDHLPRGARMVAFVGMGCGNGWAQGRLEHLPSLAIVRREAFANDQWTVAGSHLVQVRPPWDAYVDPSQMVGERPCKVITPDTEIAKLKPELFDYVWLIDPAPFDARLMRGWTPVWRQGASGLYRLPAAPPPASAAPPAR